ncbi:LysM peptidoglycan-binding domain-containing protein [Candidatus Margulisiibacteriota bacterium]
MSAHQVVNNIKISGHDKRWADFNYLEGLFKRLGKESEHKKQAAIEGILGQIPVVVNNYYYTTTGILLENNRSVFNSPELKKQYNLIIEKFLDCLNKKGNYGKQAKVKWENKLKPFEIKTTPVQNTAPENTPTVIIPVATKHAIQNRELLWRRIVLEEFNDNQPKKDKLPEEIFVVRLVKQGETLGKIAKDYGGVSYQKLAEINNLSNPDKLDKGQKLLVPAHRHRDLKVSEKWVVDTYDSIKNKQNGRLDKIDPAIMLALIAKESSFRKNIDNSWSNGLTQFTRSTGKGYAEKVYNQDGKLEYINLDGKEVTIKDKFLFKLDMLFNPDLSIRLSMEYINDLMIQSKGDMVKVFAWYNGGKFGVPAVQDFLNKGTVPEMKIDKKTGWDTSFRQTILYVYKIMHYITKYASKDTDYMKKNPQLCAIAQAIIGKFQDQKEGLDKIINGIE